MRIALLLLLTIVVSACASTGAVPRPFPAPGGAGPGAAGGAGTSEPLPTAPPEHGIPLPADAYALTGTALSLRGVPYRNGGSTPSGFDCSGFVQYVFGRYGLALPREVRDQFRSGSAVDRRRVEPGDLVFFTTVAPGASHVGIAVGGDQFVHAPSSSGVVRVEHLSTPYWASRYVGARRVQQR